eukprot:Trichotokara_eunicae@DN6034_c0_g1_i5.p2
MKAEARAIGADAILGVKFSTSMIMQGASEVMVFGTGIKWLIGPDNTVLKGEILTQQLDDEWKAAALSHGKWNATGQSLHGEQNEAKYETKWSVPPDFTPQ